MKPEFKEKLLIKLHRINIPSINKRVKFNKIYNNLLKKKCKELNIQFVDLEQILLKNDTEPLYLNNFMDHHLHNREGIRKLIILLQIL